MGSRQLEIYLVYNASELYSCLEFELQKIGITKPKILQLYMRTWLRNKLWEIHSVPLNEEPRLIPSEQAYKTLRVLPEYLDRMLFYTARLCISTPTDLAKAEFDFELGQLLVRYYEQHSNLVT